MSELKMVLSPHASATRVIAVATSASGSETVLKARLLPRPAHPRALQWLLEALALWQGQKVRAALCAAPPGCSSGTHLYPEWFADFGDALYSLELQPHPRDGRRVHKDALAFGGEFGDLRQLTLQMAGAR